MGLLTSVAILHFALLAHNTPDNSPGDQLERRNYHLALKLTSLQLWNLQGEGHASFLLYSNTDKTTEANGEDFS